MSSKAPPLLVGKTTQPKLQAGLIDRAPVLDRLVLDPPSVTLVQAPAGWGKTTIVAQWAKSLVDTAIAWVSFDAADDDPIQFWRYIVAAIEGTRPRSLERTAKALFSRSPALEPEVMYTLIEELSQLPRPLVVVLDDLHYISDQRCHDTLRLVFDRLAGSTRFIVISRRSVPAGINRLAARGRAAIVSVPELELDEADTRAILMNTGADASDDAASSVQRLTNGWPVATYLVASSLANGQEGGLLGSHGVFGGFLGEEILGGLNESDREFLRDTSIVEAITPPLAVALTEHQDAGSNLERLDASNLLVSSVDAPEQLYRMHHLLRDHLRSELVRRPDRWHRQHGRASRWYLEQGDISNAISHAFDAGDQHLTATLLAQHWYELVMAGHVESVWRWLERLGLDSLGEYPFLVLAAAWTAAFRGDAATVSRFASLSKALSSGQEPPDGSASFVSARALMLATMGIEGVTSSVAHAETALSMEPEGSPWSVPALAMTGTGYVASGRLEEGIKLLERAAEGPPIDDGVTTFAMGQLALAEAQRGAWERAEHWSGRASQLIADLGIEHLISSGATHAAAAMIAVHEGRPGAAHERLNRLSRVLARSDATPFDACQLHLSAAATCLGLGSVSDARVHLAAASDYLRTLGDGGILEQQFRDLERELGTYPEPDSRPDELTGRELEILTLLETDMTVGEIGEALFVSRNTAKTHISRIYRKLDVNSRTAAVAHARHVGILD